GGPANRGGENFGGDSPKAAEVAGREERDERAEREQDERNPDRYVSKQQHRGKEQVPDVGGLPSKSIAHEPERDVAKPHAELHDQEHRGARKPLQADTLSRQRLTYVA